MPSDTSSDTVDVPASIRLAGRDALEMYERLRSEGLSHKWAEMCALQQPPGVKGTDRAYMQGRYNNQQLDAMPPDHARQIIAAAKRAGINPSGKYYASSLADRRGPADPAAWVDSTADIKRVAIDRNLTVSGAVEHKGHQVAPKRKALSERLTREMMRVESQRHPTMKSGELREMVVAKYGRKHK
jgi:hypothetical protein